MALCCCGIAVLLLWDSSLELTDDVASVQFLESVSADKSLRCRLNMSARLLMSYILITTVGEGIASENFLTMTAFAESCVVCH